MKLLKMGVPGRERHMDIESNTTRSIVLIILD
jgi:hypothetical protein